MQSVIKRMIIKFFSVDGVFGFVMAGEAEIDRQGLFYFRAAQGTGIFACDGRIGVDLTFIQCQKTIQRLAVGAFTDQCPLDAVSLQHMLAETEKSRVAVALGTADCFFAGVVGIKRRKAELLPAFEFCDVLGF